MNRRWKNSFLNSHDILLVSQRVLPGKFFCTCIACYIGFAKSQRTCKQSIDTILYCVYAANLYVASEHESCQALGSDECCEWACEGLACYCSAVSLCQSGSDEASCNCSRMEDVCLTDGEELIN